MTPIYDAYEVSVDPNTHAPVSDPPVRNTALYCPSWHDQSAGFRVVDHGDGGIPLTADGTPTPGTVEHIQTLGMLRHEWRMQLNQDIKTETSILSTTPAGKPVVITEMMFYCIHCMTLCKPQQSQLVQSSWDRIVAAQSEQAQTAEASTTDAPAAPTPIRPAKYDGPR